jgi:hypothetical protein
VSPSIRQSAPSESSEPLHIPSLQSISKRRKTNESNHGFPPELDDVQALGHHRSTSGIYSKYAPQLTATYDTQERSPSETPTNPLRSENGRLPDSAAAALPSAASGLLSPEIWKEQFFWPNAYTTTQCVCLMRHFIQSIAPWVSLV